MGVAFRISTKEKHLIMFKENKTETNSPRKVKFPWECLHITSVGTHSLHTVDFQVNFRAPARHSENSEGKSKSEDKRTFSGGLRILALAESLLSGVVSVILYHGCLVSIGSS